MVEFFRRSAIAKLLVAMVVGGLVGTFAPGCVIRALNSFAGTFSQFVKFIVPLIIFGLVTPAIADAGRSAGRVLLLTLALAYASTLLAGAFGICLADAVFPRILSGSIAAAESAKSFPAYFTLTIPPAVGVVTAMALAFVLGLAMSAMECPALTRGFAELKRVVARAIAKAVVPLLPLYILTVVADLAARGVLSKVGGPALKIVLTAFAATWMVLLVQFCVAGAVARRNPLKVLWTMLPAYFTGLGCCSSAATIPTTLRQVMENGVSEETANIVVPLCANIHLAGSIVKIVVFSAGFLLLAGGRIEVGAFAQYVLMLSVLAVAAPGVPGGMVLAAAPIAEAAIGLRPEHYAMLMAAYLAIDGVGTACNLTGDGAIALVVDRFRGNGERGMGNGERVGRRAPTPPRCCIVCVCAILALTCLASPRDGRRLVWGDEFDGKSLDQAKWKFHATMNGTDCVYTNDSRTARMEDGCLHLLVVPSGDPKKPQMLPRGVSTRDRMAFKYGYLEMRAKIPFRHGAWPSFWMTAQPTLRKAAWMSEVDIFEVFSSSNAVVANLHKWAGGKRHFMLPGGEGSRKRSYFFKDCAKLSDEFHVYGFEWTPQEMSFFVDGKRYYSHKIDEAHDYCPKEGLGMSGYHDFHNIHINNEIFTPGHNWCPKEKRITADDKLPIDYWIDWIRLYQKDGEEIRILD